MNEIPCLPQESVFDIGRIARELGDPGPSRGGGDAGHVHSPGGELHQHQHREPSETAWEPHLDGEEVGCGHHVPVRRQKLAPGGVLQALGRRLEPALAEHVGNRPA